MDINSVNTLSYEDFVDTFGNVIEKSPLIAAAIWSYRPFANLAELEARIDEFIDKLPESGLKLALFFILIIISCVIMLIPWPQF